MKDAGIKQLIDIRLNNVSQLAGFTKQNDLRYFLDAICGVSYKHEPLLAPTKEILDDYKKRHSSWQSYEVSFLKLMADRHIENKIPRSIFDLPTVMLCSEPIAEKCHRRLVLEYLRGKWADFEITHL